MVQVLSSWHFLLLSHKSKYPSYTILILDTDQRNLWLPKAREYNPQSNYNDMHLALCPAKSGVRLEPRTLQESPAWSLRLLPKPEHRARGFGLCWLLCDYAPFQGPRDLDVVPEDNYDFSDGSERGNVVKCKFTSHLDWNAVCLGCLYAWRILCLWNSTY